ncbi:DNA-binding protein [Sedimenticola selenatireducens]|uniref:DNA-binding protein n=1 Tax=Sedimenticola selenatireducens TaxID=191960 RepID=A0A2N6CW17_9GAMM|nr:DNA-binding protein [Sedimenticola selenatireducens]PLX61433.1 MAG: DNA-binding protein [Sedimenticola selenatireducens]
MTCSSSLADDLTPLVLDTSVLINLCACSLGEQILTAIPNAIAVPDIVARELGHETSRNNGEHQFLEGLLARKKVQQVSLDEAGWTIFERLTTSHSSLGDGEAATIAIATTSAHRPVIDDAKGRRSIEVLIGKRTAAWSLDLLLHPNVQERLENDSYIEAIYLALREGRMRIDEERCDIIVELIGVERALQCPSLPGFKARRERWKREFAR